MSMDTSLSRRDLLWATGGALAAAALRPAFGATTAPARVDVAVYGGVPCGIAAAVAAARSGASVLLIEPTAHIGGLNTSGLNTAESEHMLPWTIGGLAREFYERIGRHYGGKLEFFFESGVAENVFTTMLAEAKVEVLFGQRVSGVEKDGKRLSRLVLGDGRRVDAKVYIDAGYEGDLMSRAGVSYAIGRESREEFQEDAAGVRFDKSVRRAATVDEQGNLLPGISGWTKDLKEGSAHRGVMNYNFRLTFTRDPKNKTPIPAPQRYDRERYRLLEAWLAARAARGEVVKLGDLLDFYARRHGKYEVNNKQDAVISLGHFGGQFDYPDASYDQRERIVADHLQYTLGLLHFLSSDDSVPRGVREEMAAWGLAKDEFPDNGNWPYQLYVREARRMRGEYVMTQRDVQDDRHKDDGVCMSSHFIDCHHVQRLAVSNTEFVNEGRIWRKGRAYQIPFRALLAKAAECPNLLVAGAASFSHVAYCTYRLESVWMGAGHAAGTAAALAAKAKLASVHDLDVRALRELLREQKHVVDFVAGEPEEFPGRASPPEF